MDDFYDYFEIDGDIFDIEFRLSAIEHSLDELFQFLIQTHQSHNYLMESYGELLKELKEKCPHCTLE
jgi:hypothetical protein